MPDSLDNLLEKADLLLLGGDAEDALIELKAAAQLAKDDARPHLRQAEILIGLGGAARLKQAWLALLRAIALGERTTATYFLLMRTLATLGDFSGAQDAYNSALALDPANPRLREWGVRLARQRGATALALELVQAERAQTPDDFHWQRWEAELLVEQGDYAAAQAVLDGLLAACPPESLVAGAWDAPQWAALFLVRADARRHQGDLTGATADIDQAADLTPDDPAIPFQRGMVTWAAGDADGAYPLLHAGLTAASPILRADFTTQLTDYPRRADLLAAL
jgi:tetratricopeptide (TPR) repeat protein